jgi:hypothetical protein
VKADCFAVFRSLSLSTLVRRCDDAKEYATTRVGRKT